MKINFKKFSAVLCALAILASTIPFSLVYGTATIKVLSNNTFVAADQADSTYINMGSINTGATYQWTADSDAELKQNDINSKEMTGGGCLVTAGECVTNTAWDAIGTSTLIFNLGDTYAINQIDVWSSYNDYAKMGRYTVETSLTGVDGSYSGVAEVTGSVPASAVDMIKTSATLITGTNAKFIKITIFKGASYNMTIGEVVIMGSTLGVDKAQLNNLIYKGNDYVNANLANVYTSDSWQVLTAAIAEGVTVNSNPSATEVDVSRVTLALSVAIDNLVCNFDKKILSSNTLVGSDTIGYPSVLGNNATYAWESGHSDIINSVNATTILTNGNLADNTGSGLLWGGWDDATPAVAVFDLKGSYYLTNVDVFSLYDTAPKFIGSFKVEVSSDNGVTYREVAEVEGVKETTTALIKTESEFIPQKATNAKITMVNGVGSHQLILGEIIIQGFSDTVDKSGLVGTVNSVKKLDKTIFTIASWMKVEEAFVNADAVYKNEAATITDVKNAVDMINNAVDGLVYLYTSKVISNNKFIDSDLSVYSKGSEVTQLNYEWVAGSNSEIIANDHTNKLQSGNVLDKDGGNTIYGGWGDATSAIAKYTFLSDCYINQIDVWSGIRKDVLRMGSFDVEVSLDDITYDKVASINNLNNYADIPSDIGYAELVNTVAEFKAVKAKYVKITIKNSTIQEHSYSSSQLVIGEVIIQGFKAPYTPPIQFQMFNLNYTNGDTLGSLNKLSEIGSSVYVNGDVFNNSENDKNIVVISALYDNNNILVGLGLSEINSIKGIKTPFEVLLNTNQTGITDNYSMKTYVWSNINSCVPLANIKTFGDILN